jgi:hypothetical protein
MFRGRLRMNTLSTRSASFYDQHVYQNIERIQCVTTPKRANQLLTEGWLFLQAVPTGVSPSFVLGMPKPKQPVKIGVTTQADETL